MKKKMIISIIALTILSVGIVGLINISTGRTVNSVAKIDPWN